MYCIAVVLLWEFLVGWKNTAHVVLYGEFYVPKINSNRCTLAKCLDFRNCKGDPIKISITHSATKFSYEYSKTEIYAKILEIVKKSRFYTDNPFEACLFLPSIDTLCHSNNCDPSEPIMEHLLHSLPTWNPSGNNHLLFEISDRDTTKYNSENAIGLRSSWSHQWYRHLYDVAIPPLPNIQTHTLSNIERNLYSTNATTLTTAVDKRRVLVSFKGSLHDELFQTRLKLTMLNNDDNVIIITKCHKSHWGNKEVDTNHDFCMAQNKSYYSKEQKYDYEWLLLNSEFGIVPRGLGLHSNRLIEVLAAGSIPVILADDWVLPFENELIDWNRISIRLIESRAEDLITVLKGISTSEKRRMQDEGRQVYSKFLRGWEQTVEWTLELLNKRIQKNLNGETIF